MPGTQPAFLEVKVLEDRRLIELSQIYNGRTQIEKCTRVFPYIGGAEVNFIGCITGGVLLDLRTICSEGGEERIQRRAKGRVLLFIGRLLICTIKIND